MPNSADLAVAKPWRSRPFLPALAFSSPLFTSIAPNLTWLFLVLLALTLIIAALRQTGDWRNLLRPDATLGLFLVLIAYVCLSAVWAADPAAALSKSGLLLGVILIAFAAANAVSVLEAWQLRRTALAFAAGALAGALFVIFELLTSGLITRAALNAMTLLHTPKRVHMVHGDVVSIKLGAFRQNVGLVVLHFWPALLALTVVANRLRRSIFAGLLFVTAAGAAFVSRRMSAQLALLASMLTFPFAMMWRRQFVHAVAALWCLAFAIVLPVSFAAYDAELHMASWLERSARVRVIIWGYTAERVLERPWLGIGADSTIAVQEQSAPPERPEGFVYPRKAGPHAHNLFLQTWYELGLVGAVLFALTGAMLILRITLLPRESQCYAAATFVTFATMAGFAWGMWQTWLICAAGLTFLYLRAAAAATAFADTHNEVTVQEKAGVPLDAGPMKIA